MDRQLTAARKGHAGRQELVEEAPAPRITQGVERDQGADFLEGVRATTGLGQRRAKGGVLEVGERRVGCVAAGQLDPDGETVLLITGDGLKTLDALGDTIGPRATVPPSAEAVIKALG